MRVFSSRWILAGIFLLVGCLSSTCHGQAASAEVDVNGETTPYALLAAKLKSDWDGLPEQDAVDIAAILQKAKLDPETTWLIKKMKEEDGSEVYRDFAADITSPQETVQALQVALRELKALEILFQDPERAFQELRKEGLIPPDKIKMYEKNKGLLEEDFRKQMYFMLVSYAAAGGYL
mmetsp:Transcript_4907/g.9773  ORF Transcript_4907/g.9773 Transcript_4907/m.9773 type:complete len:178 (+) Transcript_4907:165-698(+)|eukprot:scaffold2256_cov166-Amphora_coffeaeformis.AAC.7